jgi:hypothetical protein
MNEARCITNDVGGGGYVRAWLAVRVVVVETGHQSTSAGKRVEWA